MNTSPIRQLVTGWAASQSLCFVGEFEIPDRWYDGYKYIVDCIDSGKTPDPEKVTILDSYELSDWQEVIREIDERAASVEQFVNQVLSLAKDGLVHAAIEGELPTDLTQVNLSHFVELGQQHSA